MQETVMGILEQTWSVENTPSVLSKSIFYYLQSAGHFVCDCTYATRRSQYDSILLVHTLAGRGSLAYRGQKYTVTPGKVFLIDCMEEQHYETADGETWIFDFIHFNGSESRGYVNRILSGGGPVHSLASDSILPRHLQQLQNLLLANQEKKDIKASLLLVGILTELLLLADRSSGGAGSTPMIVKDTVELIERDYGDALNLDGIAERLCISKYHLSRLFKRHTGYSLYEYLIKYRLNQGKRLLKLTDLPVHEIAHQTGFESPSHFIKMFGRHEDVTPLTFRKFWR